MKVSGSPQDDSESASGAMVRLPDTSSNRNINKESWCRGLQHFPPLTSSLGSRPAQVQQNHGQQLEIASMSATRVGIIGGGICGPVMAMLLKLKGYSPVIYERWPEVKNRGLGIG